MNNPITPGDEHLEGNIGKLLSSTEPRLAMPESSKARVLSALLRSAEAAQPITETQVIPDLTANTQDPTPPAVRLVPDVPTELADGVQRETHPIVQPPSRRHVPRRLLVMFQSNRVRWSAAAAVAAAVLLAIGFWPGKAGRAPGSAFAAAIQQFQNARTIVCRISASVSGGPMPIQQTGRLEISTEHGSRCELRMNGTTMVIQYSPLQGPPTLITPLTRTYTVMDTPAAGGRGYSPQGGANPEHFILALSKLKGQASRDLGRTTVDGVDSLGYEITGELLGLGPAEGVRSELWVDAKTCLPVRYVAEIPMPEEVAGKGGSLQMIYDRFEWDTPLDPKLFVPQIPADYKRVDARLTTPDEAALIKGLGNYAELAGKYPPTLSAATMATDFSGAISRRIASAMARGEKAPDQQELMTKTMEISSGIIFYQKLAAAGRSPEYFGKTVSPGQKDSLLVRWKTEDGQWRIIYGDLRVTTLPEQ